MTTRSQQVLDILISVGPSTARPDEQAGPFLSLAKQVVTAETPAQALAMVQETAADLILVRETVPEGHTLLFLRQLQGLSIDVPVVVLAQEADVEAAVKFMRLGAQDYIQVPASESRLAALLADLQVNSARSTRKRERFFAPDCPPGVPIVGQSAGIRKSLELIRLVAASACDPVLIAGETGTGKELAARAIHLLRGGNAGNFVAVNCAGLTANLLESELFGHTKGSFTGADREKTGLFELAQAGTILLDEISEMPLDLQAKLLRVLQEKQFRKVGGTKDITCNATIIASSNRDLTRESQEGAFRKDLYYRLAVFPISMPPLRAAERCDDIPLLAEYFLETSALASRNGVRGLSPEVHDRLQTHRWPGNVRELKNVIERSLILERSDKITLDSLLIDPQSVRDLAAPPVPVASSDFSLETAERLFIIRALQETGWQRTRAAVLLGITRATLHAKLKRYNITMPDGRPPEGESQGAEPPDKLQEACA